MEQLEEILATSSGKSDGPIIDLLRVVQSSRDVAYSLKAPRRWISIEEREPIEDGVYEVCGRDDKTNHYVEYMKYDAYDKSWEDSSVTHWRKPPKHPKG